MAVMLWNLGDTCSICSLSEKAEIDFGLAKRAFCIFYSVQHRPPEPMLMLQRISSRAC